MKRGMKIKSVLALILAMTLLCGCSAVMGQVSAPPAAAKSPAVSAAEAEIDPNAVTVSTVDELLAAIEPGASILLKPGVYDLSTAKSYGKNDSGSRYSAWWGVDNGQYQLSIMGLTGLTLSAAEPGTVTLTTAGEYALLLFLESCEDITLRNLSICRAEDPEGLGQPILGFWNSSDILLEGCSLYNGRAGLECVNVRGLRLLDTDISDCDDSAAILQGCNDFLFDGCKIYDCGEDESESSLLSFQSCSDSAVINSDIYDNENIWMLNSTNTTGLYLGGLDVRQNEFERMYFLSGDPVTVEGCAFTDNSVYAWYEGTDMDEAQRQTVAAVSTDGEELTGAMLEKMKLVRPASWTARAAETPPAIALTPDETGAITVSTVDELLAAIAPNTNIILEPGVYDLSTAKGFGAADSGSKYYYWEQIYDGPELCISGVENLSISSADPEKATISAVPRYADVIAFYNCDGLKLSGLTAGHTEKRGECVGGVLYLDNCEKALVENCRLYGCGIIGITAEHCDLMEVRDTEIFDCSYGGVSLNNSRGVLLDNCDIYDCEVVTPGLISFTGCSDCAYINSELKSNSGMGLIYASYSQDIYLASLDVHDNTFDRMFYFDPYSPVVDACAFSDNILGGEWYGSVYEPTDSAKAVDGKGKELDEKALLAMSLGGEVKWEPTPVKKTDVTVPPLPDENGAIHVKNVEELLAAIAPNTKIYLEEGEYDLSQAPGYGFSDGEYYSWMQNYDGPGLKISDVDGLTITGAGADKVTISAVPRYADVLLFSDCDELSLCGFTAGHSKQPGSCSGGVLYFDDCDNVSVIECGLFGCGILGITGSDCEDMTISKTEIYQCSLGAMSFARCENVAVVGCKLYNNDGPDYVYSMCTNMTVDGEPMPTER